VRNNNLLKFVIISTAIFVSAGLTMVNYRVISRTDSSIDSPGNITKTMELSSRIPTPIGIYVSGQYGNANCETCDGYVIEEYKALQLGGLGFYTTVRIQ
jgi:hypothetical protein